MSGTEKGFALNSGPLFNRAATCSTVGSAVQMTGEEPKLSALELFGAELRHHRTKAGMTLEEFGDRVGYSYGLISQVERGKRMPQPELAAAADEVFGTDGTFARIQQYVSGLASRHQDLREYYQREPTATAIQTYEAMLIPGLLQTEAYARAVISAGRPRPTRDEVEARIATRLTRQDILTRQNPTSLWAIIGEGALYNRVGTNMLMAEQLAHLTDHAERLNITFQVLPFRVGPGASYGVSFLIADFSEGSSAFLVDIPAVRLHVGSMVDAVAAYRPIFDYLRAAALPEEDSLERIEEQRKVWHESG